MKTRKYVMGLCYLLGLITAMFVFHFVPQITQWYYEIDVGTAVRKTQRNGEKILEAIELYSEENGKYPDCLAQLIPKYLPEIPPSFIDVREWYYYRTPEAFFLGASITYPACHYLPYSKKWAVDY